MQDPAINLAPSQKLFCETQNLARTDTALSNTPSPPTQVASLPGVEAQRGSAFPLFRFGHQALDATQDSAQHPAVRKSTQEGRHQAGWRVPSPADGGGQSSESTLSEKHE